MEKKISFGFSRVAKKPQLVSKPNVKPDVNEEKIELIDCLEGQSIKIAGKQDDIPEEAPLVIPLTANTTPLEKVKQLREEAQTRTTTNDEGSKIEKTSNGSETLEERAAREIMANLKASDEAENEANSFTVPLNADEIKLGGAKESTLDDYEDVPITNFGLAMLRGMGWKDEEHKQKQKGLEDDMIVCRPKGLGLGADKAMKQQVKLATNSSNTQDKLVMKRDAFVRIIAGKRKDFYGQVEGMDDESGRVFIKMALGGNRESINEAFVQLVTEKEYKENRKVLNMTRYEEYKNKDAGGHKDEDKKEERHESRKERSSAKESRNEVKSTRRPEEGHNKERRGRRSRSRSTERGRDKQTSTKSYSRYEEEAEQHSHRDRHRDKSESRDRKQHDSYKRDHSSYKPHRDSDRQKRRDR